MNNKELIKKKNCGECICDGCERRFVCWTTKRIFSDPVHQALYEAYIAEGLSSDSARDEVKQTIERAIMETEMREAANRFPKPDIGTPEPYDGWRNKREWVDEWKIDEWKKDEWKDIPHYEWTKRITNLPVGDAKKEIKDLTQYFRSMISGKNNKV